MNKDTNGMDRINMLLGKAEDLIPTEIKEQSRIEPVSEKQWWEDGFMTEDALLFMEHLIYDKQFNANQMLDVLRKPYHYTAMYNTWYKEGKR